MKHYLRECFLTIRFLLESNRKILGMLRFFPVQEKFHHRKCLTILPVATHNFCCSSLRSFAVEILDEDCPKCKCRHCFRVSEVHPPPLPPDGVLLFLVEVSQKILPSQSLKGPDYLPSRRHDPGCPPLLLLLCFVQIATNLAELEYLGHLLRNQFLWCYPVVLLPA